MTKLSCDQADIGIFIYNSISTNGCDSIHKLQVLFSPPDTTPDPYSCLLSEAGVFETTFVNSKGCDSFAQVTVLYLPPDNLPNPKQLYSE